MRLFYCLLSLVFITLSCESPKIEVDRIFTNANIYTVDSDFSKANTLIINADTIVAVGGQELTEEFDAEEIVNLDGKTVLPGLIDAHAHILNFGLQLNRVDLFGTNSYKQVVKRITDFVEDNPQTSYIIGRGWDQNDWPTKQFPTKDTLDLLFPDVPVALTRIDGHAMLVNQAALDLANINSETNIFGGEVIKDKNNQPTGVLIDAPMSLVRNTFPSLDVNHISKALKNAEDITLSYGLTTVVDAGLSVENIQIIDSLQKSDEFKTRIYAMIRNHPEDIKHYLENGIYKTKHLNVRSFKVYADGALGSRGAALKEDYSDQPNHFGSLVISLDEFNDLAKKISNSPFQMNTHAIGDSANYVVLQTYDKLLSHKSNQRWRVEHAQVLDPEDYEFFDGDNILASVQPTHATSDMYWADERLGQERIKHAYAYKTILKSAGNIALGTDFPIEKVNPFLTFYAAVTRQDLNAYPENGFNIENSLTREETLKGMTIWAAYANFEETEKGSLEAGKLADFVILDRDIMQVPIQNVPNTEVLQTIIGGQTVYKAN